MVGRPEFFIIDTHHQTDLEVDRKKDQCDFGLMWSCLRNPLGQEIER